MEAVWDINFTHQFERDVKRLNKSGIGDWLSSLSFLKSGPQVSNNQLKALKGQSKAFRWRKGDLRVIFRVIGQTKSILLLAAGHRKAVYKKSLSVSPQIAGCYDDLIISEPVNGGCIDIEPTPAVTQSSFEFEVELDEGVLEELFVDEADLYLLGVPQEYYPQILDANSLQDLEGKGIPAGVMKRLEDYLTAPGSHHVGRIYSLDQADDFDSIASHTLDRFLVSLDPQQKGIVEKSFEGGPWLIRGGPGTGKTLINLARIKRICREGLGKDLLQQGPVRIGFVTFNKPLSKSAEAMFKAISSDLGGAKVEFLTLDSMVYRLLKPISSNQIAYESEQESVLRDIVSRLSSDRWDRAYIETVKQRRGLGFLLDEFNEVILGNGLTKEDDYISFARRGRKVAVQEKERGLIHALYGSWVHELRQRKWSTFAGKRFAAEQMIARGDIDVRQQQYDFLFIDELQDLSVIAIRLLTHMIKHTQNLTFTADTAQSIYLKSPSWSNISEDIRFHSGNSFILRKSYRMTHEIERAVRPLRLNAGDAEKDNDGIDEAIFSGNRPSWLDSNIEKHPAVAAELAQSLIEGRSVNPGQVAIITPDKATTKKVRQALEQRAIPCDIIANGKGLALGEQAVHLLHVHAAKGLEFPFVIVVGVAEDKYPQEAAMSNVKDDGQLAEVMDKAKRLLYVALSRAARGLWMVTDHRLPSPLLDSLNREDWDVEYSEEFT